MQGYNGISRLVGGAVASTKAWAGTRARARAWARARARPRARARASARARARLVLLRWPYLLSYQGAV